MVCYLLSKKKNFLLTCWFVIYSYICTPKTNPKIAIKLGVFMSMVISSCMGVYILLYNLTFK